MSLSVFDLFKIGIGPSSSHTVGPMRAAAALPARARDARPARARPRGSRPTLYGSLALTGQGHATDKAILLGLSGERPDTVDPDAVGRLVAARPRDQAACRLLGRHADRRSTSRRTCCSTSARRLPRHPNGMRFTRPRRRRRRAAAASTYYSVGGGFVVERGARPRPAAAGGSNVALPYPFGSAAELLELCGAARPRHRRADAGERAGLARRRPRSDAGLLRIWAAMEGCIERGCRSRGHPARRPAASAAARRPCTPS